MQIQVIGGRRQETNWGTNITWSPLNAPRSLDEFDVNVIDLTSDNIWQNEGYDPTTLNCINDFKSIQKMVEKRSLSRIIYQLPQNTTYHYNKLSSTSPYRYSKPLKDMLGTIRKLFLSAIIPGANNVVSIIYENTRTELNGIEYTADFYFDTKENVISKSLRSKKATTILLDSSGIYATTLDISASHELLGNFLSQLFANPNKSPVPVWINDISMLDDNAQKEIIDSSENDIRDANSRISNATQRLAENAKYKSILYTNGSELVEVIFNILGQILNCNLSNFVDEKKEDFLIQKQNCTFIGEIKGVTSNVKNEHISQVDVHYQGYMDKLADEKRNENVHQLLIINPFRTKPIAEREPVHEQQIALAKRNGCLIIETLTLLRIFEKFVNGSITSEQCIAIFSNQTGLLQLSDFEPLTPEELESFNV